MAKLRVFIVLLTFILHISVSYAQDKPLLNDADIQKMDKGRSVLLNKILEDGSFIFISEDEQDSSKRILITSPSGRVKSRFEFPAKDIEYIASDNEGRNVIAYSQDKYSFYLLDTSSGKWELISQKTGAEPGFALFGGKKSRISFSGSSFYAYGYFYDRAGDYIREGIVRIRPERRGMPAFELIMTLENIDKLSSKYYPEAKVKKYEDIDDRFITFIFSDKPSGSIVLFDLKKWEHFKIADFENYYGSDIDSSSKIFTYIIQPQGSSREAVLFIYDLQKKLSIKAVPGRYYNPVFNQDGRYIAAGTFKEVAGRVIAKCIEIIPSASNKDKTKCIEFPGKMELLDWKFTGRNEITIFTKDGIYRKRY